MEQNNRTARSVSHDPFFPQEFCHAKARGREVFFVKVSGTMVRWFGGSALWYVESRSATPLVPVTLLEFPV